MYEYMDGWTDRQTGADMTASECIFLEYVLYARPFKLLCHWATNKLCRLNESYACRERLTGVFARDYDLIIQQT